MADNKKGFMLYADQKDLFNKLPDEIAGKLIKLVFSYVNDENPEINDLLLEIAFTPIKNQLKRDLKKWSIRADRSRENGKLGGRPKEPKKPSGLINNLAEPRKPDNVNVNVKDNVIVKVNKSIEVRKTEFKNSLHHFLEKYDTNLLNEFYLYWTEKKPKGRKMLFEMQKTFDIKRRLERWDKNDFNKKEKSFAKKPKEDAAVILQRKYGLIK